MKNKLHFVSLVFCCVLYQCQCRGGVISGRLYDLGGKETVKNECVVIKNKGCIIDIAHSDSNGFYSVVLHVEDGEKYTVEIISFGRIYSPDEHVIIATNLQNYTNLDFATVASGSVSGYVYDSYTNPIPDVLMRAQGLNSKRMYSAKTDSDGSYEIIVPVGSYRITPSIIGDGLFIFTSQVARVISSRDVVTNVNFVGHEGGMTTGHVYDDNADTIGGVIVMAIVNESGKKRFALTDADGVYSFRGLVPGTYSLSVVGRTIDYPEGKTIELIGGQSITNHNFQPYSGCIKGHVYNSDGFTPVEGALLKAKPLLSKELSAEISVGDLMQMSEDAASGSLSPNTLAKISELKKMGMPESRRQIVTDENGNFILQNMQPGNYLVSASKGMETGQTNVYVDSNLSDCISNVIVIISGRSGVRSPRSTFKTDTE